MHRLDGPEREKTLQLEGVIALAQSSQDPGQHSGVLHRVAGSQAWQFISGTETLFSGIRRGRAASWSTTKDATVAVCMGSEQLPDGLGCSVLCC
jgi:hypothetical protein